MSVDEAVATEAPIEPIPVVDVSQMTLDVRSPIELSLRLALQNGGVYIRRYHGFDIISASSLEAAIDLSDEDRFEKYMSIGQQTVRGFTGDGLFTAFNDEPNWQKAHDILLPAFSGSALRRYHTTMVKVAKRLIGAWDAADDEFVDVADDMTRMTLDTIGLTGFGYDFSSFERAEPHPFVSAMVRGLAYSQSLEMRRPDDGLDHSAADAEFKADCDFIASVVDEVIEARTTAGTPTEDDMLSLMLETPHPVSGEKLDPVNARYQVVTFLAAGHETTSGSLAFAMYFLVNHPEVLRRARAEVDALWGDTDEVTPSYEDIGNLTYVRQVFNESLRLWPAAAGFSRQAKVDTTLLGRHPMNKGDWAVVLAPVLHRDPTVWGDNPNAFDPDHFSPEREAARSVHAFKPFGTGERACIGRQFAMHEAVLVLGLLIHRYRFLDPESYQLRIAQRLTMKPADFRLKVRRRVPAERRAVRAAVAAPGADVTAAPEATGDVRGLPRRVRAGNTLHVLHGSNLGNSLELAEQVAELGAAIGFQTVLSPLDDYATADLPRDEPVVVVASSYNGRPTDDAARFVERLAGAEAERFADGVRFCVLGVGDRNWPTTYQRVPTLIDDRLAAAGGRRLLERVAVDVSTGQQQAARRFTDQLRQALLTEYGDPGSTGEESTGDTGYQVEIIPPDPWAALAARHDLRAMTVVATGDLADPARPEGRAKRSVSLRLPDGQAYRTGDHLVVLPVNEAGLVDRAAGLLGAGLDTLLAIRPGAPLRHALPADRPLTVRDLLARHLELQDPATAEQIARLAELNPCPPEQVQLAVRAPGHASVLDLIERFPALAGRLDWATVLELFPPMRIRYYSVSSSAFVSPGVVDLMVSRLDQPHRSGRGRYQGTGSGYLNRVEVGDVVLARVSPRRDVLGVHHERPTILVSAGTGLAPFRGAIADRMVRRTAGGELAPSLCYFGCTDPEVDFLYSAELTAADRAGVVSLRPAFSRVSGSERGYVQDRIAADGDEVWQLLEDGATVYVCGDATGMGVGVRRAFEQLHGRKTGSSSEKSAAWLADLMVDDRYVEDIYAAG
ncbi:cytochrome P450 [Paractinoplanes ferrugineus]|uniref:Bifunctional cytochrome P450/NADPH--P450 reductase n=1 Tax=Paractinoplanes ferrugineus TaxID=113564 RepID=A0A919J3L7_9ACTN|nr:cytochrome P450 [Actinoplanes ferrugineus]GIE12742.1 NADPH--cytochrome P450 reductase [Actinoplanes ferrugineus]